MTEAHSNMVAAASQEAIMHMLIREPRVRPLAE